MTPNKAVFFGLFIFHALLACSFPTDCTFLSLPKAPCCSAERIYASSDFAKKVTRSWPCLLPLFLRAVVYMGPRTSMLYSYEDPWRVSAFIFVFTQLLLTVLVLVHTILVCITFQLMKWYGWWIPSRRNSVYRQGVSIGFGLCATQKPLDIDSNASRSSPSRNTERFLKRSSSEDWRSVKSNPLVCPKCHGVRTFKQGLSFTNDIATSSQLGETPVCSDVGSSRGSHVEGGFRIEYATEDSVNNMNTPSNIRKLSQTLVHEDGMLTDGEFVAEAGSSSKVLVADGIDMILHKDTGLEMANHKLESSDLPWCIGKEMQEAVFDEELSAVMKRKGDDSNDYCSDNAVKCCKDDESYAVMAKKLDGNGYDSESVIKGLRQAIQKERQKLCALYGELEVERIASETAANEAMSMISRLQEEKAGLVMQAAHFQRMAEEKANHDEEAMQLLKEILYRKERENYFLEKEVKFMRTRFCKDVRKYGKKRHDVERRSFFVKGEETLLLTNVEEVSNRAEGRDTTIHLQEQGHVGAIVSVEKPSCQLRITEEQPLKRLKGFSDHENGSIQSTFLMAGSTHVSSSDNYQKACILQQSVAAANSSDGERVFEFGLEKQVCEKMHNGFDYEASFEEVLVPLKSAQSASSVLDSELEAYHFVAASKESQKLLSHDSEEVQMLRLCDVGKGKDVYKSGDMSHKEAGVCMNQRRSEFLTTHSLDGVEAMMSCCEASTSVAVCATNGRETPDQAGAEFLQSSNFDLKDCAWKDLQTKLQIFESGNVSELSLFPEPKGFRLEQV